jgi:hypothetical protein
MAGIADIALGAAPIAGGALLATAAGSFKGPDFRGMIKQDLDLLERIPPDRVELRAALQRSIDERIADLIVSTEKTRELREVAASYRGNWRDIIVFICAILFTIVWWNVNHNRSNWLVMFIVMIALSVLAGVYAGRGLVRAIRTALRPQSAREHGKHGSAA